MKKILRLSILILFILLLPKAGEASEKKTMKTIEQELTIYLNDPLIIPETEAYYTYLMNQLLFGNDKELASKKNYSDIVTYMSGYLNNMVLPAADFYEQTPEELLENNNSKENISRESHRSNPAFVNAGAVQAYAERWWNDRNPNFQNWNPNNCANYVSQLLLAGGVNRTIPEPRPTVNVYDTTDYWYSFNTPNNNYEQSTSWIRVLDFFNYWNRSQETISPQNLNPYRDLDVGDVIQLQPKSGGIFYHSMMVIDKDDKTVYLTGNSNDRQRMDIREIKDTNFRAIKFTRKNGNPPLPNLSTNIIRPSLDKSNQLAVNYAQDLTARLTNTSFIGGKILNVSYVPEKNAYRINSPLGGGNSFYWTGADGLGNLKVEDPQEKDEPFKENHDLWIIENVQNKHFIIRSWINPTMVWDVHNYYPNNGTPIKLEKEHLPWSLQRNAQLFFIDRS